ncbi:MAG: FliH/SctL family protein [Thermodesulfobacteriota bacterium]|nr:MAG: FliH/SctL family protein [Thermodesulfobacteriota bacterium]
MSSSNIIRNRAVRIMSEPFTLVSGQETQQEEKTEDVGSRLEALEREAYERGFSAGEKAGFEFGLKKAEVHFSGLEGLVRDLVSFRESLYAECEREITALALAIAVKVVQREVEINPDGVLECVKSALRAVAASGEVTIRVNPKEFEVVNNFRPELMRLCGGLRGLSVEPDELVQRGGCLVSTSCGEIDATIASISEEIEAKLKDAYARD